MQERPRASYHDIRAATIAERRRELNSSTPWATSLTSGAADDPIGRARHALLEALSAAEAAAPGSAAAVAAQAAVEVLPVCARYRDCETEHEQRERSSEWAGRVHYNLLVHAWYEMHAGVSGCDASRLGWPRCVPGACM